MADKQPGRFEKLLNMTRADLAKDVLGVPICPVCNGAEWITDAEGTVPCECVERKRVAAVERENARAQIIVAFLDEIEATEFITADGCDRDVDPDGFGFSGQMLKLIEAIAEDENDVWNTAARCALAGSAPAETKEPADPEPGFCEQCNDPLSAEERHCYSGDLVFCSPECRDKYLAKL